MKTTFKNIAFISVFVLAGYIAQAQPVPGTTSGGGAVNGAPIGGGAPIGSGTLFLLALAGLYGGKRVYFARKIQEE